MPNFETFDFL